MSGETGRTAEEIGDEGSLVYPATIRVLDKKRMGGTRGMVEYTGVPLPGTALQQLGIEPGDSLGLSRESEQIGGEEIPSIWYSLDGSGEMSRQIRGGTKSKPTWVISLPYEWVEPEEYPIDPDEEPSFMPLEDGDRVVLELHTDEGHIRVYRSEDYRFRMASFDPETAPEIREHLEVEWDESSAGLIGSLRQLLSHLIGR